MVLYAYIVNINEVTKSVSRIKTHKATGPDEIPNWILHDYATILAPPVWAIFNSSVQEGTVAALWKCADVRPMPNSRPPALTDKDLRSISLTPVLSNCFGEIHVHVNNGHYHRTWNIKRTRTGRACTQVEIRG